MTAHRALVIVLSLSLAFTGGLLLRREHRSAPGPLYRAQRAEATEAASWLDRLGSLPRTYVNIAARLRPSVVTVRGSDGVSPSSGTGVIFDDAGHILTNLHVIDGMSQIEVTLSSRDRYAARVVGRDPATDLAVLSIPADSTLYPAVFGDSEYLEVGEEVLAIGNAYGLGWTVTKGIVSSLHRSPFDTLKQSDSKVIYANYVQTDAAINPGNSGGPLVNGRGEVIGINSTLVSGDGESHGIGFAIPSADAAFVARELVRRGTVERGYLGVHGQSLCELSRRQRHRLHLEKARGSLVLDVVAGSPAARAGFRTNDVILSAQGRPVDDYQVFRHAVARLAPGSTLEVELLRDGRRLHVEAVLGRRPESEGI